jgi:hypothetical protein
LTAVYKAVTDGGANRLYECVANKADKYIPDIITGDFDSVSENVLDFYRQNVSALSFFCLFCFLILSSFFFFFFLLSGKLGLQAFIAQEYLGYLRSYRTVHCAMFFHAGAQGLFKSVLVLW